MEDDTAEVRITLRLPTALRDRLLKAAEENSRSMNGEIVNRLDSFDAIVSVANSATQRADDKVAQLMEMGATIDTLRAKMQLLQVESARVADLESQRDELNQKLGELRLYQAHSRILTVVEQMLTEAAHGDDSKIRRAIEAFKLSPEEVRESLAERLPQEPDTTESPPPRKRMRHVDLGEE